MKVLQPLCLLALLMTPLQAVNIAYTSGAFGVDLTLFSTSSQEPLDGGYLRAGTFTSFSPSSPPSSLGLSDVITGFEEFAPLNTNPTTGGNGAFLDGGFTADLDQTGTGGINFAGGRIYLVVTDTADITAAKQLAVISSSDLNWQFPGADNATVEGVGLPAYTELLAGRDGVTLTNPGGIPGVFPAIELMAVPEPSASILALLGSVALLRRRR